MIYIRFVTEASTSPTRFTLKQKMKYLLAIILYSTGCWIAFGFSPQGEISPVTFFSLGTLLIVFGSVVMSGKAELTKRLGKRDFIPDGTKLEAFLPRIFGAVLVGTSLFVLGEEAFEILLRSPFVGVALWFFLLSLAWQRFRNEGDCVQQIEDAGVSGKGDQSDEQV